MTDEIEYNNRQCPRCDGSGEDPYTLEKGSAWDDQDPTHTICKKCLGAGVV